MGAKMTTLIGVFFTRRADGFRGVRLLHPATYGLIDFDASSQALRALEVMQGQPISEECDPAGRF